MATRSRIGIEHQDGTVTSIYCHWDGHVETNGKILFENYHLSKTKQLIALGDISSLGIEVEPTDPNHSFEQPQEGVTVAYCRDRGEDFRQSTDKDVETFFSGDFEQFGYCFTKDGRWLVSDGGPVVDLIVAIEEGL